MPGATMHAAAERLGGVLLEAAERRQAAQGDVHLRHRSGHAVVADPREECRIEVHRIDETEQRSPRIDGRYHGRSPRARCRPLSTTPRAEPSFTRTRSTSTPVRISAPASIAASAIARCHGAGSANRGDAAAAGHGIRRRCEQQNCRRCPPTTVPWRCRRFRGSPRSLQQVRLEPFGHQIGDRHRSPPQQAEARPSCRALGTAVRSSAAPTARRPTARRSTAASSRAACRGMRRALATPRRTRDTCPASAAENGADRLGGPLHVGREHERPAVRRRATTSRGSGRTNCTPRRSSCMSRTIDGRSGPSVCASVGAL